VPSDLIPYTHYILKLKIKQCKEKLTIKGRGNFQGGRTLEEF
jgi:hypothetical protein